MSEPTNLPERASGSLSEQAANLSRQTPMDHVVNIIKATMNAVPLVGGPLASLMGDYISNTRAERLESFARDVAAEMERVAERLKADYVQTDEFAFLFTRAFENASRDYQREKLEVYRNILVNALMVNVLAAVQENYLNRAEALTVLDIRLLSAFRSDAENAPKLQHLLGWGTSGSIANTLQTLLPGFPSEQMAPCARHLDGQGITSNLADLLRGGTMTAEGAAQLETRLTPFGRGFVQFISRPR